MNNWRKNDDEQPRDGSDIGRARDRAFADGMRLLQTDLDVQWCDLTCDELTGLLSQHAGELDG